MTKASLRNTTPTSQELNMNEETKDLSFDSKEDARKYALSQLHMLEPALAGQISNLLVDAAHETEYSKYRVQVSRWVIKNEDLDLITSLSPTAITCATAAADPTSAPAVTAAVATSLASLVLLIRRLKRYTIRLTSLQQKTLLAIRT